MQQKHCHPKDTTTGRKPKTVPQSFYYKADNGRYIVEARFGYKRVRQIETWWKPVLRVTSPVRPLLRVVFADGADTVESVFVE